MYHSTRVACSLLEPRSRCSREQDGGPGSARGLIPSLTLIIVLTKQLYRLCDILKIDFYSKYSRLALRWSSVEPNLSPHKHVLQLLARPTALGLPPRYCGLSTTERAKKWSQLNPNTISLFQTKFDSCVRYIAICMNLYLSSLKDI